MNVWLVTNSTSFLSLIRHESAKSVTLCFIFFIVFQVNFTFRISILALLQLLVCVFLLRFMRFLGSSLCFQIQEKSPKELCKESGSSKVSKKHCEGYIGPNTAIHVTWHGPCQEKDLSWKLGGMAGGWHDPCKQVGGMAGGWHGCLYQLTWPVSASL